MSTKTLNGFRAGTALVLLLGGGALAAATWIGGEHGLAVGLVVFYVVAAAVAYWWAGRDSDTGAIMRAGGDERQRRIDRDAMSITGIVLVYTAIVGAIVSAAVNEGDIGAFGLMAAVGGITYAASIVYLKRTR